MRLYVHDCIRVCIRVYVYACMRKYLCVCVESLRTLGAFEGECKVKRPKKSASLSANDLRYNNP